MEQLTVEEMISKLKSLDPKAKIWTEDPENKSFLPAMRVTMEKSNDSNVVYVYSSVPFEGNLLK